MADDHTTESFCGCCGELTPGEDDLWCDRCLGHVGGRGPLYERTWEAITGERCPYAMDGGTDG